MLERHSEHFHRPTVPVLQVRAPLYKTFRAEDGHKVREEDKLRSAYSYSYSNSRSLLLSNLEKNLQVLEKTSFLTS